MVGSLRIVSLLIPILLLSGCSEANRYVEPPPPEVTVVRPVRRPVTDYVEATGTAQPVISVDIRARVRGFLKEQHFREGSAVKKGQLLLVIDEEPFRLALDQVRLRQAEAEASLRKARQSKAREVGRAQLALDLSQLSLAKIIESRQRTLTGRGVGTREEMDQAEATRKKNEAQVEATRAQLDQMEADYETNIHAAEAVAGSARMAVRNAEIELGYCRMYSPDRRPDQPDQLPRRQPRRRRPVVAAGDDRQDRPDLRLHQRERGRPAPVPVADRRGRPLGPRRNGDAHGAGPGRRTRLPAPGTVRLSGAGRRLRHGHRQATRDLSQPRRRDPAGVLRPGPHPRRRIATTHCSCPSGRWGPTSPARSCSSWGATTSSSTGR